MKECNHPTCGETCRREKKPKKIYVLPKQTSKERVIKKDLSKVKHNIELDEVQDGTYFCKGCGTSYVGLDKVHIIPVGKRKALELLETNMFLGCRVCHIKWDSGDIIKMATLQCFDSNMAFIKIHDLSYYNQLQTKMEDFAFHFYANA